MGKRGPAPKPTNLRVLHGDRKDRINTAEPKPKPLPKSPPAPIWMADDAKKTWRKLAPELHAKGLLTDWDRDAFAVYCEAVAQHRRACELADTAMLVKGPRGHLAKNPAMQLVRDTAQTIRAFAQEFGLTPSARSGITMPELDDMEAAEIMTPKRRAAPPK